MKEEISEPEPGSIEIISIPDLYDAVYYSSYVDFLDFYQKHNKFLYFFPSN